MREICDRYDVLLLFDEIVTGFGRLGTMWGADHVSTYPDLMEVGKGTSGGYAPLAALLVRGRIASEFWGDEERKLESAHTFNANPLSTATGYAVLSYILEHDLVGNSKRVGQHLLHRARGIADHYDAITEVMGAGLWVTMFVARDPTTGGYAPNGLQFGRRLHQNGRNNGLLIRPYPSHILLGPPLTITRDQVDDMMDRLDRTLALTLEEVQPELPASYAKIRYGAQDDKITRE